MKGIFYSTTNEHAISDYASLANYESLVKATSLEALGREVNKATTALGFQHYLYGAHIKQADGEIFQYIFSGYPDKWMKRYLAAGYIDIDPVVEHCFKSNNSTPIIWPGDIFDTPARQNLMKEAQAHGIYSGLSVPLRGTHNEVALLSAANNIKSKDCYEHSAIYAGSLYVLLAYMHEAIRDLVYKTQQDNSTLPELTAKENECLLWWGAGKSVNEIGNITGITPRTVRFHLDNVKKKLKSQTKAQTIARAYKLGIIVP